ncbi:S-methyl-5'-thioadenosine phosphorylase [Nocardia brevicatena]|uniref:S-methyl-5'-thioadenosine phosphorylase n=1 Tax=Nocardia brevicatena TaxID=37327 RepID=UPI0002EC8F4B|nr:S-methyl-5'-thioadenosine phosphorylase [Nocardia brevicatena]
MITQARPALAVIGGSGFYDFFDDATETVRVDTPYGDPSAPITVGTVEGRAVAFLPRHGTRHEYSPHTVPYQANMWALRSLGVRRILAPCAVGSLRPDWGPGTVVVPDQLVDRTSGRTQTFFDRGGIHVSFADPYCAELRGITAKSATEEMPVRSAATMVVVQGPRFSSRAESRWFAGQGWDLVNMTGHPEAVLARELEMCYAAVALVTDLDAGVAEGEGVRAVDVFAEFERNIVPFKALIRRAVAAVGDTETCDDCRVHAGVSLPFELP